MVGVYDTSNGMVSVIALLWSDDGKMGVFGGARVVKSCGAGVRFYRSRLQKSPKTQVGFRAVCLSWFMEYL